jgi:hypothetical protein
VIGDDEPRRPAGRARVSRAASVVAGLIIVAVALAGLGVQAVRGNRTVSAQRDPRNVRGAKLDNAYYRCLDVQTRSLVAPGEPVWLTDNFGNLITLVKGVGSWVTIADQSSSAAVKLSIRSGVTGHQACLGSVVVGTYAGPHGGLIVRLGSGASVPGIGPPPAPPL